MNDPGPESEHCPPVEIHKEPHEIREELEEYVENNKGWMERAYRRAERTKIGGQMNCAGCGTVITKKSYQQKFCRVKQPKLQRKQKRRKRKGSPCKDRYWNVVEGKIFRIL